MSNYVIVASDGKHYFPFEGCRFLELPEYQDENFDMDSFVEQYTPNLGMKITAEFDDGELVHS